MNYDHAGHMFPNKSAGPDLSAMTLRDYFAGQALAGGILEYFQGGDAWDGHEDFASTLYAIADAMLKEREK